MSTDQPCCSDAPVIIVSKDLSYYYCFSVLFVFDCEHCFRTDLHIALLDQGILNTITVSASGSLTHTQSHTESVSYRVSLTQSQSHSESVSYRVSLTQSQSHSESVSLRLSLTQS